MKRLYLKTLLFMLLFSIMRVAETYAQCISNDTATVFSTNTTLSGVNEPWGYWVIDSTVTLKVHGTVKFRKNGKIIIKKGGKLELHGAALTRECGSTYLWDGIYIQGDNSRDQWTSSNYDRGQGVLITDSSSTIEWSEHGIVTTGGAIIQAINTTFHNNYESVTFNTYLNPYNINLNLSNFDACDFLCDDTIPGHSCMDYFIGLNKVKGVWIKGCSFINSVDNSHITSKDVIGRYHGTGIQSHDANFIVNAGGPYLSNSTCTWGQGRRSLFQGLTYGILHHSIYPQYNMNAIMSDFTNIQVAGIVCFGDYYATIHLCHFLWNSSLVYNNTNNNITGGVMLEASRRFDVDSNTFNVNHSGSFPYYIYPIAVENSTEGGGTIYSNYIYKYSDTYHYYSPGISVYNNVHSDQVIDLQNMNPKLQISCNVFSGFINDINMYTGPYGIMADQGSSTLDAGNKFSTCTTGRVRLTTFPNQVYYNTHLSNSSEYSSTCKDGSVIFLNINSENPCTPTDCLTKPR